MSNAVSEHFDKLGSGMAFALTPQSIDDLGIFTTDGKLLLEKLPTPAYPHRILRDELTGNYVVERPGNSGQYQLTSPHLTQVRISN